MTKHDGVNRDAVGRERPSTGCPYRPQLEEGGGNPPVADSGPTLKIAIAGKGGSGKTTFAGTLARLLARGGVRDVLAIDADSNPNLGITLGIARDRLASLQPMRREVLRRFEDENGNRRSVLAAPPAEILDEYAVPAADGVTLLLMGRVDHAGAG